MSTGDERGVGMHDGRSGGRSTGAVVSMVSQGHDSEIQTEYYG